MRRLTSLASVVLAWSAFAVAAPFDDGEGDDIVIHGERIDRATEVDVCQTVDLQVDALEDGTYLVADDVLTEKDFIELLKNRSNSDADFRCVEILMEPLDIARMMRFPALDLKLNLAWARRPVSGHPEK